MKKRGVKTIVIAVALVVVVLVAGLLLLAPVPVEDAPVPVEVAPAVDAGHIHMTDSGGFSAIMRTFVEERFAEPFFLSGSSGDLRSYLELSLARRSIGRGTLFSYNHRHVHQLLEQARPLIEEFPRRYPVRAEFAPLVDPRGELHLVFVDAYVIIYNPRLIARADVPSTMEAVVHFDRPIGVPTTGCIGTWGKMALFHHLGEENFRRLMANAKVRGSMGDVTVAVRDGTIAVGLSTLQDVRVRDGEVGVIWPEEGAIAKPGLLAIADNPTEANLRLADIIMSPEAAQMYAREFNKASALPGGPVSAIVKENNFHFVFIPTQAIISTELLAKVERIIAR